MGSQDSSDDSTLKSAHGDLFLYLSERSDEGFLSANLKLTSIYCMKWIFQNLLGQNGMGVSVWRKQIAHFES